jgi:hypothetical protein
MYRRCPRISGLLTAAVAAAAGPCSAEALGVAPLQCLTAAAVGTLEPAPTAQGDPDGQVLPLRFRPGSAELDPASRSALDDFLACHKADGGTPRTILLRAQAGERETASGEALALANDRKDEVARRLRQAGVRFDVQKSQLVRESQDPARVELRLEE